MASPTYEIITQPNPDNDPGYVCAAYRPIVFSVLTTTPITPDVPLLADVYINGLYYKTISSYTIVPVPGPGGLYTVDVQDALQEYLTTCLPTPVSTAITPGTGTGSVAYFSAPSIVTAQVLFRGSYLVGGILFTDGVAPVQATATTAPVAGTYDVVSYSFLVLNASIPPQFQNIYTNSLEAFLAQRLMGAYYYTLRGPAPRIYPLSNIPSATYYLPSEPQNFPGAAKSFITDGGQFPFLVLAFAPYGSFDIYNRYCTVNIVYFTSDFSTLVETTLIPTPVLLSGGNTYYLPCGIADIAAINPTIGAGLTAGNGDMYYYLLILDVDATAYCFWTPLFSVQGGGAGSLPQDEHCRLWFQNLNGHFDQVSFVRSSEEYKTSSQDQFVSYTQTSNDLAAITSLAKGLKRYNVRAGDELSLTTYVHTQPMMNWLKELFASPYILLQEAGITGPVSSGSPTTGFRAVLILDATFATRKSVKDGVPLYEVTIKVRPAIDVIQLRN